LVKINSYFSTLPLVPGLDNKSKLCVAELELIEPELWFRFFSQAAELFADAFLKAANLQ